MYSCQIKIAKVKIMIGNRTEPSSKISGLWIPRHKEHPIRKLMRLKIFLKECSLLTNQGNFLPADLPQKAFHQEDTQSVHSCLRGIPDKNEP